MSRFIPRRGPGFADKGRATPRETKVFTLKAADGGALYAAGSFVTDATGTDFLVADLPDAWRLRELEARIIELQRRPVMKAIATLASEQYRLRVALPVAVVEADGLVTTESPDLEAYGDGETEYEALTSLRRRICETFRDLLDDEPRLGPELAAQLRRYRDLIEEGPWT